MNFQQRWPTIHWLGQLAIEDGGATLKPNPMCLAADFAPALAAEMDEIEAYMAPWLKTGLLDAHILWDDYTDLITTGLAQNDEQVPAYAELKAVTGLTDDQMLRLGKVLGDIFNQEGDFENTYLHERRGYK